MKSCLVADQSDVIRKVARRILESLQFEVAEAEDGQSALELCAKRMPDAVVLDSQLEDMTGPEFVTAVRALPGGDQPVIIYCTIENDPLEFTKVARLGADRHLMKPYDRHSIMQKLEDASLV